MCDQDLSYLGDFAEPVRETMERMERQVIDLVQSRSDKNGHVLVEHVKKRIKKADSTAEKLKRRGFAPGAESALRNLSDIVAMRVVTRFVGDVYEVLEALKACDAWRVETVKDYIAHPKPNGYRSLHILMAVPFAVGGIDEILVEVQIRTIAMDCWASLEHQLRYKKTLGGNLDVVEAELKRCADEMASTDITMQVIRKMLEDAPAAGSSAA